MERELKNHSTGNRIKELRKANKLTHKELAEKLGIATRTLQLWESGKNLSFIPKMSKLADIFGVSITDLFDLPGPKGMDKIKESGGLKKITIGFSDSKETEFLVEDFTQDELMKIISQFNNGNVMKIRNFYVNPKSINYFVVNNFE